MIELADKKRFVSWLIQNVSFKKRESYWILNYLLNHEAILKHATFVHGALNTPRGILMVEQSIDGLGLEMVKEKTLIHEADKIFYDIRRNRKEPLYIEVIFNEMRINDLYLAVLEENQYQPIDSTFQEEFDHQFSAFFKKQENDFLKEALLKEIDLSLELNDENKFNFLSKEYVNLIKEEKN